MTNFYQATAAQFIGIDEDEKGLFCTIPSEKDFDNRYELRCEESDTSVEVISCSCKGHQYTGHCKHQEIVQGMWDRLYRSNVAKEQAKQEAEKPVEAAEQSAMSDGLYAKLAAMNEAKPAKVVELRSNLNGAQQSASFWSGLPSRQAIAS